MKYLGKIGIVLLLIAAAALANTNSVGQAANSNSSIATTSTNQTDVTSTILDDDDYDDNTIYVCGDDENSDNGCICIDEELRCNQQFKSFASNTFLTHGKIKIRNENFTAKVVELRSNKWNILQKDEILPGHESNVEVLHIYLNEITSIEDGVFDSFTSLKRLGLAYTSLTSINDTILTKQLGSTLEELVLIGNYIQNLTATTFQYLTKLTTLSFRDNRNVNLVTRINGINVTVFPEALSNLKTLDLSFCQIEELDDNVFINLRNLEKLDISYNSLTTIPKAIRSLSMLWKLELKFSNIVSINDCDFCGLSNLKILNLGYSHGLTYLHENAFGALNNGSTVVLQQLKHFLIFETNVSVLPENLLDWKNVTTISIENIPLACNCSMAWLINDYNSSKPLYVNKLTNRWDKSNKNKLQCHSPSTLAGTHLHTLAENFCMNDTVDKKEEDVYYICSDNDVEEEDTKIYKGCYCDDDYIGCHLSSNKLNHTNIKVLKSNFTIERVWFSFNNFTTLNKDKVLPGYEHSVKHFNLCENNISNIENGTFDKFINLYGLSLSHNNLSIAINNVTFPTSLRKIFLTNTNLQHIPTNNFTNVMELDLSKNPKMFSSSTKIIFPKSYSNLETLFLSYCNITNLNENIFVNLKSLKTLELNNNPLQSIPTAINVLTNLQHLDISDVNITVLQRYGVTKHQTLKRIKTNSYKLQKIDNCAFCNFPNLEEIDLSYGYYLSYIHENAFGSLSNEQPLQINKFSIYYSNISTLSEKLLNWKNVSVIDIQGNPLTCNCSMAWLINDYNSSTPLYVNNLKSHYWWEEKSNKNELYCSNPPEVKNEPLYKLSGDFCLNETFGIEEEKVYRVCGESGEETDSICTCIDDKFECNFLEHTNVEILGNKTTEIKNVNIFMGNFSVLNLSKFLFGRESGITNLEFYNNKIQRIENGTFDKFTALKTLDLSRNLLTTIEENVLTKQIGSTLIELRLISNNLERISSTTFMHLKKLEDLSLSRNTKLGATLTLNSFPKALSNLKYLSLVECNLTNLYDDIFVNLVNLTSLLLSNNPLTTFPIAINALSNLQHLDISNSEITVLKKDGLKMNKNFETLYSSPSKLERIESCAFCSFPNLKEVHLNFNKNLSFFHENAFGFAHSHTIPVMEKLFVAGCNLTFLPEKLLNWDTRHIVIGANGNPFTCDCLSNWFIEHFKEKHTNTSIRHFYKCVNPPEYQGKLFTEIPDLRCNETVINSTTAIPSTTTTTSPVSEASKNSAQSHWVLIILLSSILIFISLITVAAGIYYYRKRKVILIRKNGGEGEEDLLEEDFDTENV